MKKMYYTVVFRNARTDELETIMEIYKPFLVKKDYDNIRSELEFLCYLTDFSDPIEAYVLQCSCESTVSYITANRMWAASNVIMRYKPEEVCVDGEYRVYAHLYANGVEIRKTGDLRAAN